MVQSDGGNMDYIHNNYYKVPPVKKEKVEIKPNEIRVTGKGMMKNYITYGLKVLRGEDEKAGKDVEFITLKAMGRAINNTVTIAEIIKRRVGGLHQITEVSSSDITDIYEPLVEGLKQVENTRTISSIVITLSKAQLDVDNIGYQKPVPQEEVVQDKEREHKPRQKKKKKKQKKQGQGQGQGQQKQQKQNGNGNGEGKKKKKQNKNRKRRDSY